ncbi:MAG: hypothetical protein JOZ47_00360 [Kutzneria sp.]|nr:hypothetical protein [Kutzneria sp.]
MDSDAVAAVRRQLEVGQREHADRLQLATQQVGRVLAQAAKANADQAKNITRLVERLRESAASKAAWRDKTMNLGIADEETYPSASAVEEFDAPPAPKPTPRRTAIRPTTDDLDEDDFSEQNWLR